MADMDMVDTNMEMACRLPTILHKKGELPSCHVLDNTSIIVSGMVTTQRSRSDTARLIMKTLRTVRMAGCRTTAYTTSRLPAAPMTMSKLYAEIRL